MLIPIGEHELLVFWIQLFVLVAFARALGALMRRIGLPSVIGELTAGVILGPSVFGKVWPDLFEEFLPDDEVQSSALLAVSWIGVVLLLVVTGFETDLGLIQKLGRPAALVTAGSLLIPMAAGLAVGLAMPASIFLGEEADRTTFALFVALALSVSSLAVIAKILSEMGLMRRDFGQITVAAGMANDVIGWLLLGVFTGMATGDASVGSILTTVFALAAFLGLAMTIGQRAVDYGLRSARRSVDSVLAAVTLIILVMLGFGVITQWLGVEAVLGAFIAGIIVRRSRFHQPEAEHRIETITYAFFAPLFFATAGLRLDLGKLATREAFLWTLAVLAVAIIFKFIGSYIGARAAGLSQRAGVALGAGLNARGALEIVIATVGIGIGVLNTTAFTVLVLVPVITSIFASVSLRSIVKNFQGTPAELERLEREESLSRNLVVRPSRILLPSRGGPASIAAAQVMHLAWPPEAGVTVLTAGSEPDLDIEPLTNVLYGRDVEHRVITTDDPVSAIVEETKLGFGVIGLGVETMDEEGHVVSPLVDEVLSVAPIPVVIIRRARNLDRPLPAAFSKALVPVAGSPASRAAQEVAFNLSSQLGTETYITHVETTPEREAGVQGLFHRRAVVEKEQTIGEQVLAKSRELAGELGVDVHTIVRQGVATEEILATAEKVDADLVVMGANLRRLEGRPFLGHKVEYVLEHCDATVAVVLVPFEL